MEEQRFCISRERVGVGKERRKERERKGSKRGSEERRQSYKLHLCTGHTPFSLSSLSSSASLPSASLPSASVCVCVCAMPYAPHKQTHPTTTTTTTSTVCCARTQTTHQCIPPLSSIHIPILLPNHAPPIHHFCHTSFPSSYSFLPVLLLLFATSHCFFHSMVKGSGPICQESVLIQGMFIPHSLPHLGLLSSTDPHVCSFPPSSPSSPPLPLLVLV